MWKPARLLSPRFGFANHPPLARGALGCASTTSAVTIPGGSGKERFVESHRAKLTAAARRPEGTRGNFPLENCEVRRFWLVRNGWSRLLGLSGYGGRRKGLGAIFRWKIVRFGAVQPAPPTVHRTVGFDCSSPLRHINQKSGYPKGIRSFGTPEGTRTPDLLIRSQSLYPTELPAHGALT